jgi:hypothetical protein
LKPYFELESDGIAIYLGEFQDVIAAVDCTGDVMITDPPYSDHVHENARLGANAPRAQSGMDISRALDFGFDPASLALRSALGAYAATSIKRWSLVFSDTESAHLWRCAFAEVDHVRSCAWVRQMPMPQFSGDRPASGFELISLFHPPGRKRWNGGGHAGVWYAKPAGRDAGEPRVHPAQKPLALMRELVRLFSDPGETIVDPFLGSGTTLVAAREAGRKGIGIERDEAHCERAAERLSQSGLDFGAPVSSPRGVDGSLFS